jgi:putative flippase GtrA
MFKGAVRSPLAGQLLRFLLNGLAATAVHYSVLHVCIELLHVPLAAMGNGIAALFGIAASFLGNRYFVFRGQSRSAVRQGSLFVVVYATIALLHTLLMLVWADWLGLDYRIGFVLITGVQMVVSFLINKFLVFR